MKRISSQIFFLSIIISLAVVFRLIVASLGYTYDMESYAIVGKIITEGGNVYKETARYNYGPVWFSIVGFFYAISRVFSDPFLVFRFLITGFLIAVDIGIWYILHKKYSFKVSLLFLFSPISIILTGYYSQFDNLAVFLGLISMSYLERSKRYELDRAFMIAAGLLGVSLMTKHIFFAFPLWLFFSQKGLKKKLLILTVPLLIFGMGFLPFLIDGFNGIKNNVFLYSSFNNAPLWQFLIPDYLKRYVRKQFLFFGAILLGSILFRRKKPIEQALYYSVTLVIFSYAIADQYFAIVLPFISVFSNIFFLGFIAVQTLFFVMILQGGEVNWLGFLVDRGNFGFTCQIVLLFIGFLYVLYKSIFPRFHFRHLTVVLFMLVSILYGGILFPSLTEDRKIQPIRQAIEKGDYEQANTMYSIMEKNPPFAGSRFYEKLRFVRFNIEFYRTYRHALDGYLDKSQPRDWKKLKKELEIIPQYFPDKQQVQSIIKYADQQI